MCVSCGCWTSEKNPPAPSTTSEDSTKYPNVPTTKSPLSGK